MFDFQGNYKSCLKMVQNSVMPAYWQAFLWSGRGKSKILVRQEDSPDGIRTKVLQITVLNLQHSQSISFLFSLCLITLFNTMPLKFIVKFPDHQIPNHHKLYYNCAVKHLHWVRIKQEYFCYFVYYAESRSSEKWRLWNQADKPVFQCNVNMTQCT